MAEKLKKAVALKYSPGIEAPIIMAKGYGRTAQIMLEEAKKNNVYITENTELVELLGLSETGSMVPPETWQILAEIFAVILEETGEH